MELKFELIPDEWIDRTPISCTRVQWDSRLVPRMDGLWIGLGRRLEIYYLGQFKIREILQVGSEKRIGMSVS